jgi:hypothetical protein
MSSQSQIEAVQKVVFDVLAERGEGDPTGVMHTFLIRCGYFVGHKFRFEGGWAIWLTDSDSVQIYGEDGSLTKTVELDKCEEKGKEKTPSSRKMA